MNRVLTVLVPLEVVTSTLAIPALPGGVVQVAVVALVTVKLVQGKPPIAIPVAPVNPVPVIVSDVAPSVDPDVGERLETEGAGGTGTLYVNRRLFQFVPPGVVMLMLAVPALLEGVVQRAVSASMTLILPQAAPPTVMEEASVKLLPLRGTSINCVFSSRPT